MGSPERPVPGTVLNFPVDGGNPRDIIDALTELVDSEDGIEVLCVQCVTGAGDLTCFVAAPLTRDLALCHAMLGAYLSDWLKPYVVD